MTCLLKNKENEKLIKKYAKYVGSEDAAYYLLAANNGYPLDQTPLGEPSPLYAALSTLHKGKVKDIIAAKAKAYLPEMGNWEDTGKEPSIKDIEGLDVNAEDLSSILLDNGDLNRTLNNLADNNVLDRQIPIYDAITKTRDLFVKAYLAHVSEYTGMPITKEFASELDARLQFDNATAEKIVKKVVDRLGNSLNLKRKEGKDGKVYFETDDKSEMGEIKLRFVNSLAEEIYGAKENRKAAIVWDLENDLQTIYVTLNQEGGEYSLIHELAHMYIRRMWETQPILNALNLYAKSRDTSEIAEERLAQKLTEFMFLDEKRTDNFFLKLLNPFLNIFRKISRKNALLISDLITGYFACMQDISDMTAEIMFFDRPLSHIAYLTQHDDSLTLLLFIKKRVDARVKSLERDVDRDNIMIADTKALNIKLDSLDEADPDFDTKLQDAIKDLIEQADSEIAKSAIILVNAGNDINNMDVRKISKLYTDVLGYYNGILNNDFYNIQKKYGAISADYHVIHNRMSMLVTEYNRIVRQWCENYIDNIVDRLVDFGDAEVVKVNAKRWMNSEIRNGGLSWFERCFGSAINSQSPIIKIVDYLVREANCKNRPISEARGHELVELFEKYRNHCSLAPKNTFRRFCEHDGSMLTGNFIREENWGAMQNAINKQRMKLAKLLGITLDFKYNFDWRDVTRDLYVDFLYMMLDFYERNDIILPYKYEYYRQQLKYVSPDTIEEKRLILQQINILESKCKNPNTGVIEIWKLTADERTRLLSYQKEKADLANPYLIVQDANGKIISIKLKDPNTTAGRIAAELIAFNNSLKGKHVFDVDWDKYKTDLAKVKRLASPNDVSIFELYNSLKKINSYAFGPRGPFNNTEEAELVARYNAILNSIKEPGYKMPNLDRLNDDAWKELKYIDQRLDEIRIDPNYVALIKGSMAEDVSVSKIDVLHYDTPTTHTLVSEYYVRQQAAERALAVNPNALQQFEDKYMYTQRYRLRNGLVYEQKKRLSIFETNVVSGEVDTPFGRQAAVLIEPIGRYTKPSPNGLASEGYNYDDHQFLLPKPGGKWHNAKFDEYSQNKEWKALYDKFIETMHEIYQNYSMNVDNKYQLPGIRDDFAHRMFRRRSNGHIFDNIRDVFRTTEVDDEYAPESSIRPDGTVVKNVPIRWINKIEDPNLTSTDLIHTVIAMYDCSLNYKAKNDILPAISMLRDMVAGGFDANNRALTTNQTTRLDRYIDMYVYGRMRSGNIATGNKQGKNGSKGKANLNKIGDIAMSAAHAKLMAHNWKVVIKNAIDSFWNILKEEVGGKYFTLGDAFWVDIVMLGDIFKGIFNIGRSNSKSLVGAILRRNGVHGGAKESFKGQRSSWIRRVLSNFITMGEYTLVDYSFKGKIAMMVYHHHRLVLNPLTGEKEFMGKEKAEYVYSKAGKTMRDGAKAWHKAYRDNLLHYATVDDKGNLTFELNALNIIRKGGDDYTLETRIESIIRERCAVINGVLDEMDRTTLHTHLLGQFLLQMRGWMIAQSNDNFKTGHDFESIIEKEIEEKDREGKVLKKLKHVYYTDNPNYHNAIANLSTGYVERGPLRFLGTALKHACSALIHWNRYRMSIHDSYALKTQCVALASLVVTIMLGIMLGKQVEDDPEDWAYNFEYSINTGAMSERTSQLPFGIVISAIELIRSPLVAKSLYEDAGSVADACLDFAEYLAYNEGLVSYPKFDDEEKRGGYKGLQKWLKDAFKSSSVIAPWFSPNNVFKNFSRSSLTSSANFYNQQWPVRWFNYIPDRGRGRTRSNIITDIFGGGSTSNGESESLWSAIFNRDNPYNAD